MSMVHLTHCCIILPFVQYRCDLSHMLCGNFPVTLIVAAWEQLPTAGNSWKSKQVQVWARSDPAGVWANEQAILKSVSQPLYFTLDNCCMKQVTSGCLPAWVLQILCTEKGRSTARGVPVDAAKVPSQTVLHLQSTLYLSGLYPVEGSVGYWPGDGISF